MTCEHFGEGTHVLEFDGALAICDGDLEISAWLENEMEKQREKVWTKSLIGKDHWNTLEEGEGGGGNIIVVNVNPSWDLPTFGRSKLCQNNQSDEFKDKIILVQGYAHKTSYSTQRLSEEAVVFFMLNTTFFQFYSTDCFWWCDPHLVFETSWLLVQSS